MTVETAPTRQPTAVDAIADEYFDAAIALSPNLATYLGIPGHDEDIDDLSPAGFDAHVDLARRTLERLSEVEPTDAIDEVTIAAMRERLGLQLETADAGWDRAALNNLASPVQGCRDIFDLMPTDTAEQWATIATRMGKVPAALEHPHTRHREMVVEMAGGYRGIGAPVKLSRTPASFRYPPLTPGDAFLPPENPAI